MVGMGYAAVFGSLCPVGCIWNNRFGEASGEDPGAFLCFEGKGCKTAGEGWRGEVGREELWARGGGVSRQEELWARGRVSRQGRAVGEGEGK